MKKGTNVPNAKHFSKMGAGLKNSFGNSLKGLKKALDRLSKIHQVQKIILNLLLI